MIRTENLVDIPVISDLPQCISSSLHNVAVYRSYIPKTIITIEGKPCQSVYLVLRGLANLFRVSAGGKKLVLKRIGPGDWVNVACCVTGQENNLYSVRTITPIKALVLSANDFRRLLQEHPAFTNHVLNNLAENVVSWINLMEDLGLRSTSGRLAHFLLSHVDENNMIYWQCTQRDIADRLGTVADIVGRALRKFADDGLIEMPTNNCIVIVDKEGLREEALN